MRSVVRKWGNSLAVRVPRAYLEDAGLSEDSEVELSLVGGQIVIAPVRGFGLDELVDAITDDNRPDAVDWGPAVGAERW